jgi:SAM-dependent methyltransferase
LGTPRARSRTCRHECAIFGAAGDGATKDIAALRQAIGRCRALGGGEVLLPAGNYLTGAIALKSNTILRLDKDSEILSAALPGWNRRRLRIPWLFRPRRIGFAGGVTLELGTARQPGSVPPGRGPVGFYAKYLLPYLIDLAMWNPEAARLRAAWVPRARGDVLELGIGSGLNLPFYSPGVRRIYGVDPSPQLQRMARKRSAASSLNVEFFLQSAEEELPLDDGSIDTVVITWTLCSIPNARRALREAARVLKKDGHLIFLEHGRSADPAVVRWQERLTPLWKRVSGGCHLDRKIDELIGAAGFYIPELTTSYLPRGPRPLTYTYQGVAQLGRNT